MQTVLVYTEEGSFERLVGPGVAADTGYIACVYPSG